MDDDTPGYKRPPKSSRFAAGRSGNPRGRPKGSRNLKTDLDKLLTKKITVREDGEVRKVTRQEAILLGLFSKAVRGDVRAITSIFAMLTKFYPPDQFREEHEAVTNLTKKSSNSFCATEPNRRKRKSHEYDPDIRRRRRVPVQFACVYP